MLKTENNEANTEDLEGDRMQGRMKAKFGNGFKCSLSPTYVSSNPSTHGHVLFTNLHVHVWRAILTLGWSRQRMICVGHFRWHHSELH